jgi:hypothetical protein
MSSTYSSKRTRDKVSKARKAAFIEKKVPVNVFGIFVQLIVFILRRGPCQVLNLSGLLPPESVRSHGRELRIFGIVM